MLTRTALHVLFVFYYFLRVCVCESVCVYVAFCVWISLRIFYVKSSKESALLSSWLNGFPRAQETRSL